MPRVTHSRPPTNRLPGRKEGGPGTDQWERGWAAERRWRAGGQLNVSPSPPHPSDPSGLGLRPNLQAALPAPAVGYLQPVAACCPGDH